MKHKEKDEKKRIERDKMDLLSKLKVYKKKKNIQKFLHFETKK